MRRRVLLAGGVVLVSGLVLLSACTQTSNGVLTGTVSFEGVVGPADHATHKQLVVSQAGHEVAHQVLTSSGKYSLSLPPGRYAISVSGPLAGSPVGNAVSVTANSTVRRNLYLVTGDNLPPPALQRVSVLVFSPDATACRASSLSGTAGSQGGGAVGATLIAVEFRNTGTSQCTLSGVPEVSLIKADGSILPTTQNSGLTSPQRSVILEPNSANSAGLEVYWFNDCHPSGQLQIRVTLPSNGGITSIPISPVSLYCEGPSGGSELQVTTAYLWF